MDSDDAARQAIALWDCRQHPDFGIFIAASHKCASSAISAALLMVEEDGKLVEKDYGTSELYRRSMDKKQVFHISRRDDVPVRMYVRHPVDRLLSAFRYFSKNHSSGGGAWFKGAKKEYGFTGPELLEAFDDFVRWAVEHPNSHWNVQAIAARVDPKDPTTFVPTDLRSFRLVGEIADRVEEERRNASRGKKPWTIPVDQDTQELIWTHWREDFELFNQALEADRERTGSAAVYPGPHWKG